MFTVFQNSTKRHDVVFFAERNGQVSCEAITAFSLQNFYPRFLRADLVVYMMPLKKAAAN